MKMCASLQCVAMFNFNCRSFAIKNGKGERVKKKKKREGEEKKIVAELFFSAAASGGSHPSFATHWLFLSLRLIRYILSPFSPTQRGTPREIFETNDGTKKRETNPPRIPLSLTNTLSISYSLANCQDAIRAVTHSHRKSIVNERCEDQVTNARL